MLQAADDQNSSPSLRRVTIGFALLTALVALAAGGKAVLFDTLDPDAFLHLLAAKQMRAEGVGPIVDHQSFASVQTPWTPYSWLAELGMLAVWNAGGYRLAIMVQAAMAAYIMVLIALACRAVGPLTGKAFSPESGSPADADTSIEAGRLQCVLATAFAAFLSLAYFSFRPVTMGFVILATCALLLIRDRRGGERSRAAWCVIPLTALLVNVHLIAIVVPLWLAALLTGAVWERRLVAGPPDWAEGDRRVRRYALLLAGSILACTATPMLPGVAKAILHYQLADPMVSGPIVAEYQPFYNGTFGKVALGLVTLFAACALARHRRLRVGEILWLMVGFALLLRMGRFAPIFAITAAPYFAAVMPRLSDRVIAKPAIIGLVSLLLLVGLQRVGASFPQQDESLDAWVNRHGEGTPGYPCAAASYVENAVCPSAGRIINEYTWGGYLEWRLGHRYQALLDGRTNLFTPEFWQATYFSDARQQQRYFATVKADAAILPRERSRFRDALVGLGWTTAYTDDRAEVLIPPPTNFASGAEEPAGWAGILFNE